MQTSLRKRLREHPGECPKSYPVLGRHSRAHRNFLSISNFLFYRGLLVDSVDPGAWPAIASVLGEPARRDPRNPDNPSDRGNPYNGGLNRSLASHTGDVHRRLVAHAPGRDVTVRRGHGKANLHEAKALLEFLELLAPTLARERRAVLAIVPYKPPPQLPDAGQLT